MMNVYHNKSGYLPRSLVSHIFRDVSNQIPDKFRGLITHIIKICAIKISLILFKNLETNHNSVNFPKILPDSVFQRILPVGREDLIVKGQRNLHPAYVTIREALLRYSVMECYTLIDSSSDDSLFNFLKNNSIDNRKLKYKENLIFENLNFARGNLIAHESIGSFVDGSLKRAERNPSVTRISSETYLEEIIRVFDEILVDLGIDFSLKDFCDSIDNTYLSQ